LALILVQFFFSLTATTCRKQNQLLVIPDPPPPPARSTLFHLHSTPSFREYSGFQDVYMMQKPKTKLQTTPSISGFQVNDHHGFDPNSTFDRHPVPPAIACLTPTPPFSLSVPSPAAPATAGSSPNRPPFPANLCINPQIRLRRRRQWRAAVPTRSLLQLQGEHPRGRLW